MAYIGKQPQVGNYQICDAISVVNGQAAYTMQVGSTNVSPESANHMIVSLNGVIQKPGSSFTIAGSTITFASNLATGDAIDFIYLLGNVLDLGVPSDDTVGAAQIKDDLISGTTALTSEPADTDEFLVSDAGTLKRIDYSLIKASNTPAFNVTKSGSQTVSHATNTKVTWDTETYDTASAFTSNKWTPGVVGNYIFYWHLQVGRGTDSDMYRVYATLYKNGSAHNLINLNLAGTDGRILNAGATMGVVSDADDYFEVYVNTATSSGNDISVAGGTGGETSHFGGYKLIT